MGRKFGFSFSWKRALGLSAAKGKLSRLIGIPLTKSGRQRKAGRLLGDLAGSALIAGTRMAFNAGSAQSKQRPTDLPPFAPNVTPHLAPIWDEGENASEDLRLHGKSLILATQKPKGWEHLLFAQVIIDEVEKSKGALVLACGPTGLRAGAISSPIAFSDWCASRLDEMILLANQISKFELTTANAFGSVPAIISLSRPIRLFCQRCVEWAQGISNAPLDPHFREVARDLLVVSHHFIECVDRFANELMRQIEDALSKPTGGQVIIDACLKVDFPDLAGIVASAKKLETEKR